MLYKVTEQNCIIVLFLRYNDENIGQNAWMNWIAT